MKTLLSSLVIMIVCTFSGNSIAEQNTKKHTDYMPSLITTTPTNTTPPEANLAIR